jgi:pseudomonalisin
MPVSPCRTMKTVCFVALAALLLASVSFAQSWVATATQAVQLENLPGASIIGALSPQTPMHIVVGLKMQNQSGLQQLVQAESTPGNPLYGTAITPDQFLASYAPSSSQVQAVTSYLESFGFTNISAEPNNLLISADGTAGAATLAFNTGFEQYSLNGAQVFANTQAAQVPASLGGAVLAVLGLNNVTRMMTPMQDCASSVCVLNSLAPQGFWKAYDVGTTATGSKTPVAIFIFGTANGIESDLRVAEAANGLPQVPVHVQQVGIANPTDLGGGEWQLDSQMSTGMAGSVKALYIYAVPDPVDADLAVGFSRFVTDNLARAGSASFGECEYGPYLDGAMAMIDGIFLQGAAQGQTVFASTGDTGSACPVIPVDTNGVPVVGAPMVNYPASSIYAVAVGGTSLFLDSSGNYSQEIAWSAGGGGISQFEYCSYWQTGASVLSCNDGARGVPDIAMDADPYETAATIYYQCGSAGASACEEQGVGGTSLSSPLALGVWARLQSTRSNKLGYGAPQLYRFYQPGTDGLMSSDPGYHDIILGVDGAYSAAPGWDYTTGLGTFDVTAIRNLFVANP